MRVRLNGEPLDLAEGTTVGVLVASRTDRVLGVAVARGGEVVPRAQWDGTVLADGDDVELLSATAGG